MRRLDSFLPYEKYKIKEFLSGERYYIIGRKRTGKTALLKYLECKFSEDVTNLVIPIRFKSDFDLIDKKTIKSAAVNVQDEVIEQGMADKSIKSYIAAWQVYLIYQIFKHENSIKSEFQIFNNESDTYKTIWVLLKLLYGEQSGNKVVPKITKGTVMFGAGMDKGIETSVKIDIDLKEKEKTVKYNLVCKKIIDLYQKLDRGRNSVYILIDELELSVKSKKQRVVDIELIRDLILATEKMNEISKALRIMELLLNGFKKAGTIWKIHC